MFIVSLAVLTLDSPREYIESRKNYMNLSATTAKQVLTSGKSYIVNIDNVNEINPWFGEAFDIAIYWMAKGEIEVSPQLCEKFEGIFRDVGVGRCSN